MNWEDVPPDTKITVTDGKIETATEETDPVWESEKGEYVKTNDMNAIALQLSASNVWFKVVENERGLRNISLIDKQGEDERVVWDEQGKHTDTLRKANDYTEEALTNFAVGIPSTAWGDYTSQGNQGIDGNVWVTEKELVVGGGAEFEFVAEGNFYVLCASDPVSFNSTTNNSFEIRDGSGNAIFKTIGEGMKPLGVNTADISVSGKNVTLTYRGISGNIGAPWVVGKKSWTDEFEVVEGGTTIPDGHGNYVATFEYGDYRFFQGKANYGTPMAIELGGALNVATNGILCIDGVNKVRPKIVGNQVQWEIFR